MLLRLMLVLVLVLVASVSGCIRPDFQGLEPQSQYALPNSNVTPLTKVRGKTVSVTLLPFIFGDPYVSPEHKEEAIQKALAKAEGANLLINYSVFENQLHLSAVQDPRLRRGRHGRPDGSWHQEAELT